MKNVYCYKPTQDWDGPFELLLDEYGVLNLVKVNWYEIDDRYLISIVSDHSDPYDKVLSSEQEAERLFMNIVRRPYVNKSIIEELGFTVWMHSEK